MPLTTIQISQIATKAVTNFLSEYTKQCDVNKLAIDGAIAAVIGSSSYRADFEALIVKTGGDKQKIFTEMSEGKVFNGEGAETLELVLSQIIPSSRTLERVIYEANDYIENNMPVLV